MNRYRKSIRRGLIPAVFLACLAPVFGDVEFAIRFFDKKIYYPESDIQIKATIVNNSPSVYRFRLSDNRAYSLNFDVRDMANRPLKPDQKFTIDRNSNQPVFFREVALAVGEEISFTVNLKDFVIIDSSGQYLLKALFYPDLFSPSGQGALESNPLRLSVRPSVAGMDAVKDRIDSETGEILSAQALPPDEVVSYLITARRQGQWEKFFLYLDLDGLYQRSPQGARVYKTLSEARRIDEIRRYKETLRNEKIDNEILTIPQDFEVIKTTYTPREATVQVIQKFAHTGYREVKLYTYYLARFDGIWKIYSYEVQNRGTEAP